VHQSLRLRSPRRGRLPRVSAGAVHQSLRVRPARFGRLSGPGRPRPSSNAVP